MVPADEIEQQVSQIEEYCKVVSLDEVSETSKDITALTKKIESEKDELNTSLKEDEYNLKKYKNKLKNVKSNKNALSNYLDIQISTYQVDGVDQNVVDHLQKLDVKKKQLSKKIKKTKKFLIHHKSEIKQCESWIQRLKDCQTILETRYRSDFQSIQEGGNFNKNHSISGTESLPAYGSYKSEELDGIEACLVDGDYEIDSFSSSWNTWVENGTISAGTWNYPRRRYASRAGCSGTNV